MDITAPPGHLWMLRGPICGKCISFVVLNLDTLYKHSRSFATLSVHRPRVQVSKLIAWARDIY